MVKGTDPTKLKYKLTNIQVKCKMICSRAFTEEVQSVYSSGKEFAYDQVTVLKWSP